MALFTSTVDKAAGELAKLREARGRLESEDIADTARLAELRASLPDLSLQELLEGKQPPAPGELGSAGDRAAWEMQSLELRIEARRGVRLKLAEKIRGAIRAEASARAAVLRKSIVPLQAKLEAHRAKTAELAKLLQDHSGVPWMMNLQPIGSGATFMENGGVMPAPVSTLMANEIADLLRRADAIENAASQQTAGGRATGAHLDELLTAVSSNPLAPPEAAIRGWYADATARADLAWQRESEGFTNPRRRLSYTLAWDADGRIDEQVSTATNGRVSPFEGTAAGEADAAHIAALQGKLKLNPLSFGAQSA
jgi:hypothetical protein